MRFPELKNLKKMYKYRVGDDEVILVLQITCDSMFEVMKK